MTQALCFSHTQTNKSTYVLYHTFRETESYGAVRPCTPAAAPAAARAAQLEEDDLQH
jgi:hypothetical protein